jgi:predicted HAD superfamily Cof-like phosphohydrolase
MKNSEKVAEFHRVMGFPVREVLSLGGPLERDLRVRLIREEFAELQDALDAEDIIEVADALADLLYVVYGSALQFGIPIDAVLAEVHRSNMTKGDGLIDAGGKKLKGPSYKRPDIAGILNRYAEASGATD